MCPQITPGIEPSGTNTEQISDAAASPEKCPGVWLMAAADDADAGRDAGGGIGLGCQDFPEVRLNLPIVINNQYAIRSRNGGVAHKFVRLRLKLVRPQRLFRHEISPQWAVPEQMRRPSRPLR